MANIRKQTRAAISKNKICHLMFGRKSSCYTNKSSHLNLKKQKKSGFISPSCACVRLAYPSRGKHSILLNITTMYITNCTNVCFPLKQPQTDLIDSTARIACVVRFFLLTYRKIKASCIRVHRGRFPNVSFVKILGLGI